MELPISTDDIELTILEVTGKVTDRRTGEEETITFYKQLGKEFVMPLINELDEYGYDFKQVPDSLQKHEIKIPVKDLIPEKPEEQDDITDIEPTEPTNTDAPTEPTDPSTEPTGDDGGDDNGGNVETGDDENKDEDESTVHDDKPVLTR